MYIPIASDFMALQRGFEFPCPFPVKVFRSLRVRTQSIRQRKRLIAEATSALRPFSVFPPFLVCKKKKEKNSSTKAMQCNTTPRPVIALPQGVLMLSRDPAEALRARKNHAYQNKSTNKKVGFALGSGVGRKRERERPKLHVNIAQSIKMHLKKRRGNERRKQKRAN